MDVGEDMIGMVKNNTKLLYKYTIQKLTKDQIGDYYLVLKKNSMLPRYRMIIDIDYKYNQLKDIYLIPTEDSEIKNNGIKYLSNYPEPFDHVFIRLVAHPIAMYKFFGSSNQFDSHNKPRKSDL